MTGMRTLLLLFAACGLLLACPAGDAPGGTPAEEPLEVEDISLPVGAALGTEADAKGPPIIQGVAGGLPGDYPRDLPTHEPSSVNDFGEREGGGSYVELDSPTAAANVVVGMTKRLRAAGWRVAELGDGRLRASKDGQEVLLDVDELYSGSRIRIEY